MRKFPIRKSSSSMRECRWQRQIMRKASKRLLALAGTLERSRSASRQLPLLTELCTRGAILNHG